METHSWCMLYIYTIYYLYYLLFLYLSILFILLLVLIKCIFLLFIIYIVFIYLYIYFLYYLFQIEAILVSVQSMLSEPNFQSPANIDASVQMQQDPTGYRKKIRALVRKSQDDL